VQNPPVTFGALCAIHTDRTARMTCRRCGNFMCDECSVGGSETLCPKCLQLSGYAQFPYDRNNVGFSELISYCWELFKREWVLLSVAVLILMGVGFVSSLIGGIFQQAFIAVAGKSLAGPFIGQGFSTVINTIVQGIFQLGIYRICFDVLEGKKADVARMFTQMQKIGQYLIQTLIVGVAFVVPALLYLGILFLIVSKGGGQLPTDIKDFDPDVMGPVFVFGMLGGVAIFLPLFIYFGLPLSFASMELVYANVDAIEALKRAFVIAKGFRLWLIGFGFVAFGIGLVGCMACGIGLIPATALITLINTAFYFAIRNGSGLPQAPPG
jgi:hypothetical protein